MRKPLARSMRGFRTVQERSSMSSHCSTQRGRVDPPLMVLSISYIIMFARKKLKREDFLFEDGWFQTLTRRPGQLHMQQFQISDCEECNVYLFDAAACVYIDQCKYCTIFIGACEASVFVRDCTHITVICTTQQFRVRDCFECHFSIFCQSQPIIESSHDITISNFPLFCYSQLIEQMQSAKTNPWNNNWFDIYDFTPNKFNTQNYRIADLSDDKKKEILNKIRYKMNELAIVETNPIIPRVLGKLELSVTDFAVLVAYPVPPAIASKQFEVIQSKVHNLCFEQIKALAINLQCQGRIKILFVKILKKNLAKWKKTLKNIIAQQLQASTLQLYESTVFAPFKDEH